MKGLDPLHVGHGGVVLAPVVEDRRTSHHQPRLIAQVVAVESVSEEERIADSYQ